MARQDINDNTKLYSGFMATLKWVVPVVSLLVFFVIMLVAG